MLLMERKDQNTFETLSKLCLKTYLYNFSNRNVKKVNHILNMLNFYFYHISVIIRNFLILKVPYKNRDYREKNVFRGKSYNRSLWAFLRITAEKSLKIHPDIIHQ